MILIKIITNKAVFGKISLKDSDEFKIFTVAIDYANVKGCRITPNVFTNTEELDTFIVAMKTLASA